MILRSGWPSCSVYGVSSPLLRCYSLPCQFSQDLSSCFCSGLSNSWAPSGLPTPIACPSLRIQGARVLLSCVLATASQPLMPSECHVPCAPVEHRQKSPPKTSRSCGRPGCAEASMCSAAQHSMLLGGGGGSYRKIHRNSTVNCILKG